ncbi:MAG: hypothetical protein K0S37_2478 [Microbacterium sp.]|jgi:hypothetical protein|nr:hypothetical protein [Microbacterium sp.]
MFTVSSHETSPPHGTAATFFPPRTQVATTNRRVA